MDSSVTVGFEVKSPSAQPIQPMTTLASRISAPARLVARIVRLVREHFRDFLINATHTGFISLSSAPSIRRRFYSIVILAHSIEKGLSLPTPKKAFGKEKMRALLTLVQSYDRSFSAFPLEMAYGAINAYLDFHRDDKPADPFISELANFVATTAIFEGIRPTGGVKIYSGIEQKPNGDIPQFALFLRSRSSCRNFKQEPVSAQEIVKIIETAQAAPSQCNRQSSRAHLYQAREQIIRLLKLQSGASGFADQVPNLFVVTSDVTAWSGPGQRNQCYVDGALFAQSLLLACHAYNIAACPLNLAIDNRKEARIKDAAAIPPHERLIMMIAFGRPAEDRLRYAMSPRLPVGETLVLHP